MNRLNKHKLSDLYEIGSGISTSKDQAGHGTPFVSFSTIFNNYFLPDELPDLMKSSEEEQEKYSVKVGDVFLTRTSETIDELAMSSVALRDYPTATFSGFAKRLRPIQHDITYTKFMAFYLRSGYFRKIIDNNATMTLRASFNEDIFSYINIFLPDYDTQVKIGDFLYDMEKNKTLNEKIILQLENMAKAIYKYWFIQFEFPNSEGNPYKSSGGEFEYNKLLKRNIPIGWEVQDLKSNQFTKIIKPGLNKFNGTKVYLPTACVKGDKICDIVNVVSFDNRESRANMQPLSNSVWFAKMKNSRKNIIIGDYSKEYINSYIFSTGFCGVKCKEVALEYIWNFINNDLFEFLKDRFAHGATQQAINNNDLSNFNVLIPDDNTIKSFHDAVKDIYHKKYTCQIENQTMTEISVDLIQLFVNGQLNIV